MVQINEQLARTGYVLLTITDSHGAVVLHETVREDDVDQIVNRFLHTIR